MLGNNARKRVGQFGHQIDSVESLSKVTKQIFVQRWGGLLCWFCFLQDCSISCYIQLCPSLFYVDSCVALGYMCMATSPRIALFFPKAALCGSSFFGVVVIFHVSFEVLWKKQEYTLELSRQQSLLDFLWHIREFFSFQYLLAARHVNGISITVLLSHLE